MAPDKQQLNGVLNARPTPDERQPEFAHRHGDLKEALAQAEA
jgi:hypothetical protein